MKYILKIVLAVGLVFSLFTLACKKNGQTESVPDNISNTMILAWNEVAYQAGSTGSTNTAYEAVFPVQCPEPCTMQTFAIQQTYSTRLDSSSTHN